MAKKEQCEHCCKYIQERGLCRRKWSLPMFDDTDCELFGKDETAEAVAQDLDNSKEELKETVQNVESLSEQATELRQRHGCVAAWLAFNFVACVLVILVFLFLLSVSSPDLEKISEIIGYIFSAGIMLTAVILLYRWNVWGFYIIVGVAILNILVSILVDGKIGSGIGSFAAMIVAFNMQAKDGYTFFDHLGVTNRRKRVQQKLQSHYINQTKRKSD